MLNDLLETPSPVGTRVGIQTPCSSRAQASCTDSTSYLALAELCIQRLKQGGRVSPCSTASGNAFVGMTKVFAALCIATNEQESMCIVILVLQSANMECVNNEEFKKIQNVEKGILWKVYLLFSSVLRYISSVHSLLPSA